MPTRCLLFVCDGNFDPVASRVNPIPSIHRLKAILAKTKPTRQTNREFTLDYGKLGPRQMLVSDVTDVIFSADFEDVDEEPFNMLNRFLDLRRSLRRRFSVAINSKKRSQFDGDNYLKYCEVNV